jgi:hypothetical protein
VNPDVFTASWRSGFLTVTLNEPIASDAGTVHVRDEEEMIFTEAQLCVPM